VEPAYNSAALLTTNSRGLLLTLDWKSGFEPLIEATLQRSDILESLLPKLLRQTGAGGFVRSSAVGDNRTSARDLRQVLLRFSYRNAQRTWQLDVRFPPGLRISRIDKDELFTSVHPPA
jgi:hypothetical protein